MSDPHDGPYGEQTPDRAAGFRSVPSRRGRGGTQAIPKPGQAERPRPGYQRGGGPVMEDWKAGLWAELRAIEIATGDAAAAQLPALLRRLQRHQAGLGGNPMLALYRRWRIRRLTRAVADARWHAEHGRVARLGGLDPRR
jgi:hypothetical protein